MFRELLPLLTTKVFSLRVESRLRDAWVRIAMLHGNGTWALNAESIRRLERNEMNILCNVRVHERISTKVLVLKTGHHYQLVIAVCYT